MDSILPGWQPLCVSQSKGSRVALCNADLPDEKPSTWKDQLTGLKPQTRLLVALEPDLFSWPLVLHCFFPTIYFPPNLCCDPLRDIHGWPGVINVMERWEWESSSWDVERKDTMGRGDHKIPQPRKTLPAEACPMTEILQGLIRIEHTKFE